MTMMTAETHAAQIKAARKILGATEVKRGKIPGWLVKRSRAYLRQQGARSQYSGSYVFDDAVRYVGKQVGIDPTGLLDHEGTLEAGPYDCCKDAGTCFVSEPYGFGFNLQSAQLCEAIAQALDIQWHFGPDSWWFPGKTMRITFHERRK
jgi:hypothetical protein